MTTVNLADQDGVIDRWKKVAEDEGEGDRTLLMCGPWIRITILGDEEMEDLQENAATVKRFVLSGWREDGF